jgi:hypothetical protein
MEVKDLLLPLVGALWACASLVLPLVQELNRIRDKVLTGFDGTIVLKTEHRLLLLENDWCMLGAFVVVLCIAFGVIAGASPLLLAPPRRSRMVWIIAGFVALVATGTGVLWATTSPPDYRAMRKAIAASATIAGSGNAVGVSGSGTNALNTNAVSVSASNTNAAIR